MYLRNTMEDFHVKYVSDEQMAGLNPLIRQALFDIMTLIEDEEPERQAQNMSYLVDIVPNYWEIPERNEPAGCQKEAA